MQKFNYVFVENRLGLCSFPDRNLRFPDRNLRFPDPNLRFPDRILRFPDRFLRFSSEILMISKRFLRFRVKILCSLRFRHRIWMIRNVSIPNLRFWPNPKTRFRGFTISNPKSSVKNPKNPKFRF